MVARRRWSETLCEPGIYILKDGIYYLDEYKPEQEVQGRSAKKDEPGQGVLKDGITVVTEDTPVVMEEDSDLTLPEGTYYFSYEDGDPQEDQMPRAGKILTDTWVHPGDDTSVWYYVNKDGIQEDPAIHAGPVQIESGYYYLDRQGKSQAGRYQIDGVIYTYDGNGKRVMPGNGWQQIGNAWYYFYDNGRMAANTWINNYYVNGDGVWSGTTTVVPDATYNNAFPTASTKKGLQVKDGMEEDASNLGVKHAVINIALNYVASGSGIEYKYQGEIYYMNTGYIHELDRQIKDLHNRGMIITAVVVLQWNYQKQDLILPQARTYGYNLYGWNTTEAAGRKHLEALCSFLASRYTAPDMEVVNWV